MIDKTASPPPAYFLSLSLENVRSFGEKQTISFARTDGRPAQWTIILGDNGVGKTTVLKALAGMMTITTDPDGLRPLISNKTKSMNQFIRNNGWPGSHVNYSIHLGNKLTDNTSKNNRIETPYWKVWRWSN